jgi:hypothetical protein
LEGNEGGFDKIKFTNTLIIFTAQFIPRIGAALETQRAQWVLFATLVKFAALVTIVNLKGQADVHEHTQTRLFQPAAGK